MDRLRQVFSSIGGSLAALSAVGRLAIGLVVVVVILSLAIVALVSSRTSYVPLMPGAPADKQREAAMQAQISGIKTDMQSGVLMVQADKRDVLLGILGEGGKLPDDTTILFSNLASKQTFMNSREMNRQLEMTALQNELGRIIANFPSVAKASVIIDVPESTGIGQAYRKPTAAVSVWSKGGRALTQQMVDAIAGMVAGAKSGMSPADVRVIDGSSGRQFRMKADSEMAAGDYMELVNKVEDRLQGKLLDTLHYINGVIVAVNAHVDARKTTSSETRHLPAGQGSVAIPTKEMSKELSSSGSGGAAEAGVRSNVQDDISRGASGSSRQSDTITETESKVAIGSRQENVVDARGMPTKLNVSVNVPREYIADLVRVEKNDPKAEVTQAEIDTKFTAEKERLAADIRPLVETMATAASAAVPQAQPGTVVVSMRAMRGDGFGGAGGGAAAGGVGGGGGSGGATSLGSLGDLVGGGLIKSVALGVLSLVALGMMLMLVRKAAKPVDLPSAQEIVGLPPALESGAEVVGEADEGATAMEGLELRDDELRVKKMLETIGDLVKNKPADAAGLLSRWMQPEG